MILNVFAARKQPMGVRLRCVVAACFFTLAVATDSASNSVFSSNVVAQHRSYNDCWLILYSKIYDLTTFLDDHPGTGSSIAPFCGLDATVIFEKVSDHDQGLLEDHVAHLVVGHSQEEYGADGEPPNPFAPNPLENAATARWLAEQSRWGTLSSVTTDWFHGDDDNDEEQHGEDEGESTAIQDEDDDGKMTLHTGVLPLAASKDDGRIFFYLMGEHHVPGVSLTLSQAALDPEVFGNGACGSINNAVDPQDPRCAKVTFSGHLHACSPQDVQHGSEDCTKIGKRVLFEKHETMQSWPEDHNFHVHELKIQDDIWMIANFGGGRGVTPEDYYALTNTIERSLIHGGKSIDPAVKDDATMPIWSERAARARWIVHNSLWTTISTVSSSSGEEGDNKEDLHENDPPKTFGNIRSITDGASLQSSTGQPVFMLPDVDPTAKDIASGDGSIILTFSEAALAERVTEDGATCGGQDEGMPTCGQVALYGKADRVNGHIQETALKNFEKTHPLAPWLAKGGSHMEGGYYTVVLEKVLILDYFGGVAEVDVEDYLAYSFGDDEKTWLWPTWSTPVLLSVLLPLAFVAGWKANSQMTPKVGYQSVTVDHDPDTTRLEFEPSGPEIL